MTAITNLFGEESPISAIAAEVRGHAAKRGLRQAEIGAALNLTQGRVSERMRGKTPFTVMELYALATLFGIDVTDLFPTTRTASATAGVTLASESGRETTESGSELPRLDLNQQPCDYGTSQMAAVFRLNLPPAYVEVDDSSPHPIAPVVPLHSDEPVVTKRGKKPALHPESGVHVARRAVI